jgi:hypothetical protein
MPQMVRYLKLALRYVPCPANGSVNRLTQLGAARCSLCPDAHPPGTALLGDSTLVA